MRGFALIAACLAFVPAVPQSAPGQSSALEEQERAILEKYAASFEAVSEEAQTSGLRAANRKLLSLTNEDSGPAMALVIGNMLYGLDPENSYALHKRAYEARTNDPSAVLEWAMERHRKGEYADAAPLYGKYLKQVPEDMIKQALLADCLVRTGALSNSVVAWESARHGQQHTGIDFAIFSIYGGLPPARRRDDLLEKIRAGDNQPFESLIHLDAHYDRDWWNEAPNGAALKADLELAAKKLGGDSQRYKELAAYGDIALVEEMKPDAMKAVLSKAGLVVGDPGRLPANSQMAQGLIERVVGAKLETQKQLLARFEKSLNDRARATPGDADALNLLCYLYVDADPEKLPEADRYGWEHFGDGKFAASYLAGLDAKSSLPADNPDLIKALRQFPEDGFIRGFQIRAVGKDKLTREILVAAIKAEYRKLSPGMAIRDSYTLKGLFALLKENLAGTSLK